MKIFISSDHGGFELKSKLKTFIQGLGDFDLVDLGPYELNPTDDYPIFAKNLSEQVLQNQESLGILICRTGVGMSIAANRFKGIYAALCTTKEHAKRAREHENANVLCLDSEFIKQDTNLDIVKIFLETKFTNEERHIRRIKQINQI